MTDPQPPVCEHGIRWPHPCEACFEQFAHEPVPAVVLDELIAKWQGVNIGIPLHADDLEQIRQTIAALRRLRAGTDDDTRLAAARYRWLRAQHWEGNTLCPVVRPKENVRLGSFCPSGVLLDAAIDERLKSA